MSYSFSRSHPAQIFITLWRHRELVCQLTKRDILSRYRGSFGGVIWLIITPLLVLSLYTVVFGIFMKAQFPGVTNPLMYALIIYVALIIYNFFSECVNRSPTIILGNVNYVKKIIFPLEIYPWIIIGSALFHALINTCILALFCLVLLGKVHVTIFLLPFLLIPLILVTLGISWFLSSAGVFLRDIAQLLNFFMLVTMYLSPVFYSITNLPIAYQKILMVNPLTYMIEQARNMVIFGNIPGWQGFIIYLFISIATAWLGFFWFQNTKDSFADVL